MTVKKWSDIRAREFTPEELQEIDREVEGELLEMDLRASGSAGETGAPDGKAAQLARTTG